MASLMESPARSYKMYADIQDQASLIGLALKEEQAQIARLRSRLDTGKRVWLVGMGASLVAATAALYGCDRVGIKAIEATDVLEYEAPLADACDLAIVVSQSGESFDTVAAARKLHDGGVEVWSVTNDLTSRLAQLSSETVFLHAGVESGAATKTFTITLAHLSTLLGCPITSSSDDLSLVISEVLEQAQKTEEWADLLAGADRAVILGTGRDKFVAQEAALLLEEKARLFALGMSAAEFIHGPVEILSCGTPVILIETGPYSQHIIRSIARRVSEYGAETFGLSLASKSKASPSDGLWEDQGFKHVISIRTEETTDYYSGEGSLPDRADVLRSITAVIPFQLLAYYLAVKKGYNPDSFRYIDKVQSHY